MDHTGAVTVLLVGDSLQAVSSCHKRLERAGCQCVFTRHEEAVNAFPGPKEFDIVLSVHKRRLSLGPNLRSTLAGTQTTLFYAFPLEAGCMWIPVLKRGRDCAGAPALRPEEFSGILDRMIAEIIAAKHSQLPPAKPISFTNRVLSRPARIHSASRGHSLSNRIQATR
jgi:hypothetical protein